MAEHGYSDNACVDTEPTDERTAATDRLVRADRARQEAEYQLDQAQKRSAAASAEYSAAREHLLELLGAGPVKASAY